MLNPYLFLLTFQVFREACRSVPSVVFVPHISEWWETVSDTLKSTFLSLLLDVPSFCPVLILATAETLYSQLSEEVRTWQDLPDNNKLLKNCSVFANVMLVMK